MLALRLLSEGAEGPNVELLWLLYSGMAFFFSMILVGWRVSSRKQEPPEVKYEAKKPAKKDADKQKKSRNK
ncbi:MAG: hypothetical protein HZB18_09245 [Chloroflexi bacterium]|nr:hypothetical protein [Chloroflexota bacterium]